MFRMIILTLQVGGRCLDEAIVCAQTKKIHAKMDHAKELVGETGEEMAIAMWREREREFFVRFVLKVFVGVSFVGMKGV